MWYLKCLVFMFLSHQIYCESESTPSYVVELSNENFGNELKTNNHFVMFFAPWCGHCKQLFPVWEQLAESLNVQENPNVIISKVDCTSHQEICAKYVITGYPTLKLIKKDAVAVVEFSGVKDLSTLKNFINEQVGDEHLETKKDDEEKQDQSKKLFEHTNETFVKHVSAGKHFVKFYAPWCGHCQRLAPTWEELAREFENDVIVSISKIDCTLYRPVCQEFEVKGIPTLLWIENGQKIEKYSGPRTLADLREYAHKMSDRVPSPEEDKKEEVEKEEEDTSSVARLNGNNFEHGIEKGVTFVKFYAPWCGHCQKLSPVWDTLASRMTGKTGVKIAKVDCTLPDNKELCAEENIDSYPTLFIYKNGQKLVEYNGSRSLEDLYNFVERHVGHDEL